MPDIIIDFVTEKPIPLLGAEENRQLVEKFLVGNKGFEKRDIEVGQPIRVSLPDGVYESHLDLVVRDATGSWAMVIKCAAGSLGSRERETIAAARLLTSHTLAFAVVSDGKTALVIDPLSGKTLGIGLRHIPDKQTLTRHMASAPRTPLDEKRYLREALIFKSYDSMNINLLQRPHH